MDAFFEWLAASWGSRASGALRKFLPNGDSLAVLDGCERDGNRICPIVAIASYAVPLVLGGGDRGAAAAIANGARKRRVAISMGGSHSDARV